MEICQKCGTEYHDVNDAKRTLSDKVCFRGNYCYACRQDVRTVAFLNPNPPPLEKMIGRTYTDHQVRQLIIECCSEVSCEDGTLLGKTPAELAIWLKDKGL